MDALRSIIDELSCNIEDQIDLARNLDEDCIDSGIKLIQQLIDLHKKLSDIEIHELLLERTGLQASLDCIKLLKRSGDE